MKNLVLISGGYYAILSAWVDNPGAWLSARQIGLKINQPAYMHLGRMKALGLLEEKFLLYRPTRKGWLEHHDYQCAFGLAGEE